MSDLSPAVRLALFAAILIAVFALAYVLAGLLIPAEFVAEWQHPVEHGASH